MLSLDVCLQSLMCHFFLIVIFLQKCQDIVFLIEGPLFMLLCAHACLHCHPACSTHQWRTPSSSILTTCRTHTLFYTLKKYWPLAWIKSSLVSSQGMVIVMLCNLFLINHRFNVHFIFDCYGEWFTQPYYYCYMRQNKHWWDWIVIATQNNGMNNESPSLLVEWLSWKLALFF